MEAFWKVLDYVVEDYKFIIRTLLAVISILFAIKYGRGYFFARPNESSEAPTTAPPPDFYKFIWKDVRDLTPEDILGLRGMTKYGFKKYYYRRKYHKELVKRIKAGEDAIVLGMSLSGKTRTVYGALKSLWWGYSVTLLVRFEPKEDADLSVPKIRWWRRKKKRILVIDDINNFIGKPGFDVLLRNFMTDGVTVVATCRTGPDLAGYKGTELSTNFKKPIEITKLEEEDLNEIEKEIEVEPPDGFDGNIGSLFLDLGAMKARYSELNRKEKRVLKAINRLHFGGVFDEKGVFPLDRVRRYYEEKNKVEIGEGKFRDLVEDLNDKEFLEFEGNRVKVEEAYLDEVIEGNKPTPEDFAEMITIFINDPDALYYIGLRAGQIGLHDIRVRDYMRVSIVANRGALKFWTEDNERYKYAMTNGNLANAYAVLGGENNIKEAINLHKEILNIFKLSKFPMNYAKTMGNLGVSYGDLFKIKREKEKLINSINSFNKTLNVFTYEKFPIDYAQTQNNLGASYCELFIIEKKEETFNKSIKAFNNALKVRTVEEFPIQYAMTKGNIGYLYSFMATLRKKEENCKRSRNAYEEALEIFKEMGITQLIIKTENNIKILNEIRKEENK